MLPEIISSVAFSFDVPSWEDPTLTRKCVSKHQDLLILYTETYSMDNVKNEMNKNRNNSTKH